MNTLENRIKEVSMYAYRNLSFNSDRQGEQEVATFERMKETGAKMIQEAGGDAETIERYKQVLATRYLSYLQSVSVCASAMITGPANFPTRQQEKRQNSRRNKWEQVSTLLDTFLYSIARKARKEQREKEIEANIAAGKQEKDVKTAFDGGYILENNAMDRIQIYHDTKPTPEVISILKHTAFKWSPSQGCWQRQLTRNAIWATERMMKQINALNN